MTLCRVLMRDLKGEFFMDIVALVAIFLCVIPACMIALKKKNDRD